MKDLVKVEEFEAVQKVVTQVLLNVLIVDRFVSCVEKDSLENE